MAVEQLENRIDWLDEQRRKDADLIKALQEKVLETERLLATQEKQSKDLSSDLTRIAAQVSQIRQFDDALVKMRKDFSAQLLELMEGQQKRDVALEKTRNAERESISKSVEELRLELRKIDEMNQTLEARRHEEIRISSELDALEKKFDGIGLREEEISRSLKTIEDFRNTDSRRIAELQSESTNLRKRNEALRGMVDTIEDRSRRIETTIAEHSVQESSSRDDQNVWMERQELRLVAFEKEWNQWLKKFEAFQDLAEVSDKRLEKYDENHRAMKKTKTDLEKMLDRLERRISEIAEVQRIAEDRIKKEWSVFLADDMRRWNTYQLTNDEQSKEHERLHEKLQRQIERMDQSLIEGMAALETISESGRRQVMDLLSMVREWAAEHEMQIGKVK